MRADRLVAALLILQARGRVTAAQLAGRLEVSVATARRDLEALSAAGSGSVSADAKAALRKLVRALPHTFRAGAEDAAAATIIDPARWGERGRARPPMVDRLQNAVVARRRVRLAYTDSAGQRTERPADPWGLVDKDDIWYLIAGTDAGRRTFRVDRIAEATPTGEPANRPDGFALAEAWEQVVGEVEQKRSRTWATVLIEPRFVPILRDHFGRHCHADPQPHGDGRARVRLGAPTARDIARNLAGWGAMVEVVEPEPVQAELARIGIELAQRYSPSSLPALSRVPRRRRST